MILSTGQYSTSPYRQQAALEARAASMNTAPTAATQSIASSIGQTLSNAGSATVSLSEAALAGLESAGKLLVTGLEDTAVAVGHGLEATFQAAKTGLVDVADELASGVEGALHLATGGLASAVSEVDALTADAASWSGKVAADVNSLSAGAATATSEIAIASRNIAAIRGGGGAALQTLNTIV